MRIKHIILVHFIFQRFDRNLTFLFNICYMFQEYLFFQLVVTASVCITISHVLGGVISGHHEEEYEPHGHVVDYYVSKFSIIYP